MALSFSLEDADTQECIKVDLTGDRLLGHPLLNKGTAFTEEERDLFGLHGLLPQHVSSLEEQLQIAYTACCQRTSVFDRLLYLDALHDRNETLFYRLVQEHIHEMLPLVYTPHVGDVALQFSRVFRRARGAFFAYPMRNKMEELFNAIPNQELDLVVVTDGEHVMGLGDLGVGGLLTARGKLTLYTLFGGIHPGKTLPIILDVGTDNQELLNNPLYSGWRHPRVRGPEYDQFLDDFVAALHTRFPNAIVQWEDFGQDNALPLLKRFQTKICSYNDDIQGTAAVVLASLLAGCKEAGTHLKQQRIVIYGANSTGLGIAHNILEKMVDYGLNLEEAKERIYLVDGQGLLHTRRSQLNPQQAYFAQQFEKVGSWDATFSTRITLHEVIRNTRCGILIGVSGHGGAFTKEIVMEMAAHHEHPLIFPLSNPARKSEAKPIDLVHWTSGKAIITTGSPFAPVFYRGRQYIHSQCNNAYIFPGIALGAIASNCTQITDKMFMRAADVLSELSPFTGKRGEPLLPSLAEIQRISQEIAFAVGCAAQEDHLAPPLSNEILKQKIAKTIWKPRYSRYIK